jgi:hypothetical protein
MDQVKDSIFYRVYVTDVNNSCFLGLNMSFIEEKREMVSGEKSLSSGNMGVVGRVHNVVISWKNRTSPPAMGLGQPLQAGYF